MLTPKQQKCQRMICDYFRKYGRAPSFEEIQQALGLASRSGPHRLVHGLAQRGYIAIPHSGRRALRPLLEPDGRPFGEEAPDVLVTRTITAYEWGRAAHDAGRGFDSCQLSGDFATAWALGWNTAKAEKAGGYRVEIWAPPELSTEPDSKPVALAKA